MARWTKYRPDEGNGAHQAGQRGRVSRLLRRTVDLASEHVAHHGDLDCEGAVFAAGGLDQLEDANERVHPTPAGSGPGWPPRFRRSRDVLVAKGAQDAAFTAGANTVASEPHERSSVGTVGVNDAA